MRSSGEPAALVELAAAQQRRPEGGARGCGLPALSFNRRAPLSNAGREMGLITKGNHHEAVEVISALA